MLAEGDGRRVSKKHVRAGGRIRQEKRAFPRVRRSGDIIGGRCQRGPFLGGLDRRATRGHADKRENTYVRVRTR